MAAGDVYAVSDTAVANGGFLDLGAGFTGADTEAVVQVIDHPDGLTELHAYDGALSKKEDEYAGTLPAPVYLPIVLNGQRFRLKNTSGGVAWLRGLGRVTK